jgi:hypothetical protein
MSASSIVILHGQSATIIIPVFQYFVPCQANQL